MTADKHRDDGKMHPEQTHGLKSSNFRALIRGWHRRCQPAAPPKTVFESDGSKRTARICRE
jgi:hypothetical protein